MSKKRKRVRLADRVTFRLITVDFGHRTIDFDGATYTVDASNAVTFPILSGDVPFVPRNWVPAVPR